MPRRIQIAVIGDSREIAVNNEIAYQIGGFIAERGWTLVTGGRNGVMHAASKGASEKDGLIVSVLPGPELSDGNPFTTVKIPTGIGYARNSVNALSGDIVVAVGGGAGTLSEIAYAWTYRKPIIACEWATGWSAKLAGQYIDDTWDVPIIAAKDLDDLKRCLIDTVQKLNVKL